jgi:hypothetical protein
MVPLVPMVTMESHAICVTSIRASQWKIAHACKPIGWTNLQGGLLSLNGRWMVPIGGGVLILALKFTGWLWNHFE